MLIIDDYDRLVNMFSSMVFWLISRVLSPQFPSPQPGLYPWKKITIYDKTKGEIDFRQFYDPAWPTLLAVKVLRANCQNIFGWIDDLRQRRVCTACSTLRVMVPLTIVCELKLKLHLLTMVGNRPTMIKTIRIIAVPTSLRLSANYI